MAKRIGNSLFRIRGSEEETVDEDLHIDAQRLRSRMDRLTFQPGHDRRTDARHSLDTDNVAEGRRVDQKLLVAAIDIGTTYSGYAFSFAHEQLGETADPNKIHVNTWENDGGSRSHFKTPSCLLLHPNGNLHSFGNAAIVKYNTLTEEEKHRDWYFFWQFKMTLHQEEEIRGDAKIKEENGKEMESLTVFKFSIQYLKEHLMNVVRNSSPDVRNTDVRWVITVPAIWKDSAKKFMRQAANQAGIEPDQIEIALEPESASLYCRSMKSCRVKQDSASLTNFPKGTRYMVLDCGGGTVDVTVHEMVGQNTLRELHAATGGDWGGTKVNKAFWNFISQLAGPEAFHRFSTDSKGDYLNLLADFEVKKRMTKPDSSDVVTIRIPASLFNILNEKQNNFAKVEGNVSLIGDKLRIKAHQFRAFFDVAITEILNHVEELVEAVPGPLQVMLLVGGFADSPILQKAIKDQFSGRMTVIIPIDASLCVMKGAVLYGFNPSSVATRVCRYTYGVATSMTFRPGEHPPERKSGSGSQAFCDDIFDKHVEIGQEIPTDKAFGKREYYPITNDDKLLHVSLYRSNKKDPEFVDERGCQRVGTAEIKVDTSIGRTSRERQVMVGIIFGSSDIKVRAKQKGGKTQTAKFILNGGF